ncbi:MAG: hypothetical protein EOP45_04600 [Sphingobacteriaceae bacterium]|nr:MAG: hypothetical protein EOP45_04600 [Sphingobacteriaceae bacterium]
MRNSIIKISITLISLLSFYGYSKAQCEVSISKKNLESGMLLEGVFENDPTATVYVAEILSVEGNKFSCRFVHSNSTYKFNLGKTEKIEDGNSFSSAKVVSNINGKFATGRTFSFAVFLPDPNGCNLSFKSDFGPVNVVTTFPDGKPFVGRLTKVKNNYNITYLHSGNKYVFDPNWIVKSRIKGSYQVGTKVKAVYAKEVIIE